MYPHKVNMFYQHFIDELIDFDALRLDTALIFIIFYLHKYQSKITITETEIIFTLDKNLVDFEDFNLIMRIFQFMTTTNTLTYYNTSDCSWHLDFKHLKFNYKDIFGSKLIDDQ